jgi:pyrimidine 5'-nucleotidase
VRFTTVFFDLDDTIYPASTGLWQAIKNRMNDYIRDRVGIPSAEIGALRERYFLEYGTTLRGLEAHHSVDSADFLAYVHQLPLEEYLAPDPHQRAVISALPVRKLIFTNADSAHAKRVLGMLNLEDCFDGIIDVNALAPYCKPLPQSFEVAMRVAGEMRPSMCAIIDDLPRTTHAARQQGIYAILFGRETAYPDADATLLDWADLPARLG